MLGSLGLLRRDQAIGRAFFVAGVLAYLVSVAGGLVTAAGAPEKREKIENETRRPRR